MVKTTGIRASSLEDLCVDHHSFGFPNRRQLWKKVIRKGGQWAKVMFCFQDRGISDEWSPPALMLASFKKSNGIYTRQTYFIISHHEKDMILQGFKTCFDCEEKDGKEMPELSKDNSNDGT